jgi:hypothetical protein
MADDPTRSEAPRAARPGERRDQRVDVVLAEKLADEQEGLDPVQLRECLEGELLTTARSLIRWAKKRSPRNPYRKLRQWARRNERGFYSTAILRRDARVVYKEYLEYTEIKRREHEEETGAPVLSPKRLDALTRIFYAPRTRAELARISPAAWAQFHEELEADARHEDVA